MFARMRALPNQATFSAPNLSPGRFDSEKISHPNELITPLPHPFCRFQAGSYRIPSILQVTHLKPLPSRLFIKLVYEFYKFGGSKVGQTISGRVSKVKLAQDSR